MLPTKQIRSHRYLSKAKQICKRNIYVDLVFTIEFNIFNFVLLTILSITCNFFFSLSESVLALSQSPDIIRYEKKCDCEMMWATHTEQFNAIKDVRILCSFAPQPLELSKCRKVSFEWNFFNRNRDCCVNKLYAKEYVCVCVLATRLFGWWTASSARVMTQWYWLLLTQRLSLKVAWHCLLVRQWVCVWCVYPIWLPAYWLICINIPLRYWQNEWCHYTIALRLCQIEMCENCVKLSQF